MTRTVVATAALAVVVSVGAVVFAGRAPRVLTEPVRSPSVVLTSAVTLVCPGGTSDPDSRGAVFAAVPPQPPLRRQSGIAVVRQLASHPAGRVARLTARGQSTVTALSPKAVPTSVVGSGSMAAGLTAVQWSQSGVGKVRSGTAVTACGRPADDWWFNGVQTLVGSASTLVLSNPSPALAVVDVAFYGPHGAITASGGRGIAVGPESSESLDLARFAPGLDALTLGIHAAQGRVVAAVQTKRTEGVAAAGSEWIPPASDPSRDVLVNAAPGGASQSLAITNPGSQEALVHLRLIDATGQFASTRLADVRIAPGSVKLLDLQPATTGAAAAVHLTSTVPVTAATVTSAAKDDDFAVSSTSPALRDRAVVAVIPETGLSLLFAGTSEGASTVTLDTVDDVGASVTRDVLRIPGSTLSTWSLSASTTAAYVVVTVDQGTGLQGVATYRDRGGLAALPIESGTYGVVRPAVIPLATG